MLTMAPRPRSGHRRRDEAGQQERGEHVDGERIPQRLFGDLGRGGRHQQHGGVVDQDVDLARPPPRWPARRDPLRPPPRRSRSATTNAASSAGGPDAGDDVIAAFLVAAADDDERALVREGAGDGDAEAAGGTRDSVLCGLPAAYLFGLTESKSGAIKMDSQVQKFRLEVHDSEVHNEGPGHPPADHRRRRGRDPRERRGRHHAGRRDGAHRDVEEPAVPLLPSGRSSCCSRWPSWRRRGCSATSNRT